MLLVLHRGLRIYGVCQGFIILDEDLNHVCFDCVVMDCAGSLPLLSNEDEGKSFNLIINFVCYFIKSEKSTLL